MATGLKNVTEYRQDYPYQGLLTLNERFNGTTLIGRTTNTYAFRDLANSVIASTPTQVTNGGGRYHKVELTQSVEQLYELNGTATGSITTQTQYDQYGNPTQATIDSGSGYSKTITNTYASPDLTNWIHGKLIQSQVTSTTP